MIRTLLCTVGYLEVIWTVPRPYFELEHVVLAMISFLTSVIIHTYLPASIQSDRSRSNVSSHNRRCRRSELGAQDLRKERSFFQWWLISYSLMCS
jgi:hypothetical protein